MSFFRSALLRRIVYAIVIALALTRLAGRSHSEPPVDLAHGGSPAAEMLR